MHSQSPQNILFIQTAFLGDTILLSSLVEKVHTSYPDCKIDILLRKGNEGIYNQHPFLRKTYIFDKSNKISEFRRFKKLFKTQRYDYVINLQRFFSSGVLTFLTKSKNKRGFKKNPLSFLYHKSFSHTYSGIHEIERNHQLIADITDSKANKPVLYPPSTIIESNNYIVLAPTSVWFTKQLPKNKWIEIIKKTAKTLSIILIGSQSDHTICEEIRTKSDPNRVNNMAGKLSILQSAAYIQNANLTIANDSAVTHLASSVNAPCITVYCSTVPKFGFYPLSDQNYIIETSEDLNCRPCGLHGHNQCPKSHFKCSQINVQNVLDIIAKHTHPS